MKLYASDNSGNSWKIRILLSVLDVPCERVDMDRSCDLIIMSPTAIDPKWPLPIFCLPGVALVMVSAAHYSTKR